MISSIARRSLVGVGEDAAPGREVLVSTSSAGGCVGFRSVADNDEGSSVSRATTSVYTVEEDDDDVTASICDEAAMTLVVQASEDSDTDAIIARVFVSFLTHQ